MGYGSQNPCVSTTDKTRVVCIIRMYGRGELTSDTRYYYAYLDLGIVIYYMSGLLFINVIISVIVLLSFSVLSIVSPYINS